MEAVGVDDAEPWRRYGGIDYIADKECTVFIGPAGCSHQRNQRCLQGSHHVLILRPRLKDQRRKLEHSNRELSAHGKDMETQIKKMSQELKAYKEMYELEMLNHMQLRRFYEQR